MIETDYKLIDPFGEIHPGEVLLEYLESNCWNQRNLARRTGITPKTISEICKGKAVITPRTALAFEKAFRRPAHFWLNLQRQYDEKLARTKYQEMSKDWISWSKKFPIGDLKKLKLLLDSNNETTDLDALLSFFGVASPEGWNEVWNASQISFRQTRHVKVSTEYISAWVRATEHYSESIRVAEYNQHDVLKSIDLLRKCTSQKAERGIEKAQTICASVGIVFTLVPAFPKTGISGCARWLSPSKALIALSNRYKTDDQLWFTFFHELAHILLHRKTHKFVIDNAVDNVLDKVVDPLIQKHEDEANRFAADALIPPADLAEFIHGVKFSNESIKKFSDSLGIAPGITVGRLQYEELLKPFQGNKLKQTIALNVE